MITFTITDIRYDKASGLGSVKGIIRGLLGNDREITITDLPQAAYASPSALETALRARVARETQPSDFSEMIGKAVQIG